MDDGMENRSKTVAIVIAILLVVVLVWFLFIRSSGEEETTTPAPVTTEPAAPVAVPVDDQGDAADGGETGTTTSDGGEGTTGDGSSETPPGDSTPVTGEDAGDDETVTLPDDWDDLSLAQKLALNPYSCDLDAYPQSMWPDGTCHPPADAADGDEGESGDDEGAEPMGDDKKEADESDSNEDEAGQS